MLKAFVISSSKIIAKTAKSVVETKHPDLKGEVHEILFDTKVGLIEAFRVCAETIEKKLMAGDLVHDRFIGVLDLPRNASASASEIPSLSSVQGMLALAFPEIQWIPLYKDARLFDETVERKSVDKNEKKTESQTEKCEMTFDLAVELCKGNYTPLFDGDGLRGQLMKRVHGGRDKESSKGEVFTRHDIALSVDEEPHFGYITSYTAYRFGYRVYPVSSGLCADKLLRKKDCLPSVRGMASRANESAPTIIAFEDVYLQFPDRTATYSNETAFGHWRDQTFPVLRDCHLRVISTAAQQGEEYAECEDGRKTTPDGYFAGHTSSDGHPYRSLSKRWGSGAPWQHQIAAWWRRQCRLIFNFFRVWPGYWLMTLADFLIIVSILVGTLFWRPILTLLVLVAVSIFRGNWGEELFRRIRRITGTIPELERFIKRRKQWQFLPMRFVGHDPQMDVHGHEIVLWGVAQKPLAGMFGLRNLCGLPNGRGFKGIDTDDEIRKLYRKARSKGIFGYDEETDYSGHAAPGAAQEVAAFILRRCERMKDSIVDAEGAVHAAVLATVAGELLNFKTPTMSIEALTWRQYFELRAECEFIGVQAHPDMPDRYIDIHNSMRRICRSSDGTVRADIYNSGMAELMDKLSVLLSENGKREEARFFEKKARLFHRRLMNPLTRNLLAYPEWLLRSAWNVVISFLLIAALFWAYWMVKIEPGGSVYCALTKTYEVLVGDEPDLMWPGNKDKASEYVVNDSLSRQHKGGNYVGHPQSQKDIKDKESDIIPEDTFRVLVRVMRQIALLHLAFLGLCFWDAMRQK